MKWNIKWISIYALVAVLIISLIIITVLYFWGNEYVPESFWIYDCGCGCGGIKSIQEGIKSAQNGELYEDENTAKLKNFKCKESFCCRSVN